MMMGEIIARNMFSWLELLIKLSLMHLAGCLFYYFKLILNFQSWHQLIFKNSFIKTYRTVLRPTKPPVQWVTGSFLPRVKWAEREPDHKHSTNAEVKNERSWTFFLYVFMAYSGKTLPFILRPHCKHNGRHYTNRTANVVYRNSRHIL